MTSASLLHFNYPQLACLVFRSSAHFTFMNNTRLLAQRTRCGNAHGRNSSLLKHGCVNQMNWRCVCTIWLPPWQEEREEDLGELQETVRHYDAATCRGSASRCLQGHNVLLFPINQTVVRCSRSALDLCLLQLRNTVSLYFTFLQSVLKTDCTLPLSLCHVSAFVHSGAVLKNTAQHLLQCLFKYGCTHAVMINLCYYYYQYFILKRKDCTILYCYNHLDVFMTTCCLFLFLYSLTNRFKMHTSYTFYFFCNDNENNKGLRVGPGTDRFFYRSCLLLLVF